MVLGQCPYPFVICLYIVDDLLLVASSCPFRDCSIVLLDKYIYIYLRNYLCCLHGVLLRLFSWLEFHFHFVSICFTPFENYLHLWSAGRPFLVFFNILMNLLSCSSLTVFLFFFSVIERRFYLGKERKTLFFPSHPSWMRW